MPNHKNETRDANKQETILAETVRRLSKSLAAERIYLFGSHARDEANEDSDFDFLVVVRDSLLPRYKREQQAFRALCGIGIAKDVLVFTREEFEGGLAVVSSLPATVAREGRLLYGG
ncbi:MAG: nucleotidyltransferase domain-containing protein [Acidobacteriota bacterium]